MSRKNRTGPLITLHGQQIRSLATEVLMRDPTVQSEEIVFWREQHAAAEKATARMAADLQKAEVTIRNQDLELTRLRKELKEIKHRCDTLEHWSR